MIAFDNFEKTTNDPNHMNKINDKYTDGKELELIHEEYIESEKDSVVEFPEVN